jgi:nucleoside-diphosphate-sugar epimerase
MKAILTGATGFIGSHLAEGLLQKGYQVSCIIRKTSNLRWIKDLSLRLIYWNFKDPSLLKREIEDADIFFHVAGLIKGGNLKEYLMANHLLTRILVEAVYRYNRGIRRFVYISSQSAAGPSKSLDPLGEDARARPVSYYGLSKYKGEEEVLKFARDLKITIIRPPVVYGIRDTGLITMFRVVSRGIIPLFGGRRYFSMIHVKDLVKGILQAAESEKAIGKVYFLSNHRIYIYDKMLKEVARMAGFKIKMHLRIPKPILYFLASISEFSSKFTKQAPIFTRDKVREITQRYWICSSKRARDELGFSEETDVLKGLRDTICWYRDNGWL